MALIIGKLSEKPYNAVVGYELDVTSIGERLAFLRRSQKLSLRQVEDRAARLGEDISRTQVADMEKGRIKGVSIQKIALLAAVYGSSVEEILAVGEPLTVREQPGHYLEDDPMVKEIRVQALAIAGHGKLSRDALEMLLASARSVRETVERQLVEKQGKKGPARSVRNAPSSGPQPAPAPDSEKRRP